MSKYGINTILGAEEPLFIRGTINGDYSGPFVSDLFEDGVGINQNVVAELLHLVSSSDSFTIASEVTIDVNKLISQPIGFGQDIVITGSFNWNLDQFITIGQNTDLLIDVSKGNEGGSGFGQVIGLQVIKTLNVTNAFGFGQTVSSNKGYIRQITSSLSIDDDAATNANTEILTEIKGFAHSVILQVIKPSGQTLTVGDVVSTSGSVYNRLISKSTGMHTWVRGYVITHSQGHGIEYQDTSSGNNNPRYDLTYE